MGDMPGTVADVVCRGVGCSAVQICSQIIVQIPLSTDHCADPTLRQRGRWRMRWGIGLAIAYCRRVDAWRIRQQ